MMISRVLAQERGQALTEFALALPVLALVLFALAEFGIMLNNQVAVANASRDGARVAALKGLDVNGQPPTTAIQNAVSDALQPLIGCTQNASSPQVTNGTNAVGGTQIATWTVAVSCTYTPITPLGSLFALVGGTTGATYQISQSTTMRDGSCFRPSCYP